MEPARTPDVKKWFCVAILLGRIDISFFSWRSPQLMAQYQRYDAVMKPDRLPGIILTSPSLVLYLIALFLYVLISTDCHNKF